MSVVYSKLEFSTHDLNRMTSEIEEETATFFIIPNFAAYITSELKKLYKEGKFKPIKTKRQDGGEDWLYSIHVFTENDLTALKQKIELKARMININLEKYNGIKRNKK